MKKGIVGVVGIVLVVGVVFVATNMKSVDRLGFVGTLFTGAEQYENFPRIHEIFPVTRLTASTKPFEFEQGEDVTIPDSYEFAGQQLSSSEFLTTTDTSALLVLVDGKVRHEAYTLTGGVDVTWLSMSVAKSFVSALIGIAVSEGDIEDISQPITQYVPELAGSAYDGVRIKDVLQMSSGAGWNEDYSDPESDVMRMGSIMAIGGSLDEFVRTVQPEREPGSYNQYNSADTQALGMLLSRATGRTITDYMQEKLWQPLGMKHDAYWMVDDNQVEMAFGGLNATARDYAKLGELYRNNGDWQGTTLVDSEWIKASVTPDAPHLLPGENSASDYPMGYGYQWWLMDGDEGEYSAIGVYNQFIYIHPTKNMVIVKLSAFGDYATVESEAGYREFETIAFFRAIAAKVGAEQD